MTNYVVPQLKEIATRGEVRSRYPVDIRASLSINTSHEEKLRDLARELMLDAVYRALNGETTQAVESILAIQAVADSHEDTPTLFSIDKKLAILNTAQRAIQAVLNITYIPERDLEILQEELQEYSEHFLNTEYYQRMIMADRVINLNMIQYASGDYKAQNAGALVFRKLQNPTAAELLVFSLAYEKELQRALPKPWEELNQSYEVDSNLDEMFIAPMATMLSSNQYSGRPITARLQLWNSLSTGALAAERYRLEHGAFPDSLDALVPAYLDVVPKDLYTEDSQPLKYRTLENGDAIIYSIGRNGIDDNGDTSKIARTVGEPDDLSVTIAKTKIDQLPPPATDQ